MEREKVFLLSLLRGPQKLNPEIASKLLTQGVVVLSDKKSCSCSNNSYKLTSFGRSKAEEILIDWNKNYLPKKCIKCGNIILKIIGYDGKLYCQRCSKEKNKND